MKSMATVQRSDETPTGKASPSISRVVEAIAEVGRQRIALVSALKAALQCRNDQKALQISRQLCGLSDEESNRTDSSIN